MNRAPKIKTAELVAMFALAFAGGIGLACSLSGELLWSLPA